MRSLPFEGDEVITIWRGADAWWAVEVKSGLRGEGETPWDAITALQRARTRADRWARSFAGEVVGV